MSIHKLVIKIFNKIKNQPDYCFFIFIDIMAIIIYFPKYIYCVLGKQKRICFAWGNGEYSDSFMPLINKLGKDRVNIILFFHFYAPSRYNMTVFKNGLPRIYANILDNKLIICAGNSKYKNLPNTIRIQIFHAPASFAGTWHKDIIDYSDALFMVTKYQWYECTEGNFAQIAAGKKLFQTGYPKIDKYFASNYNYSKSYNEESVTIFYGPTYHRDISSIFNFSDSTEAISNLNKSCKRLKNL